MLLHSISYYLINIGYCCSHGNYLNDTVYTNNCDIKPIICERCEKNERLRFKEEWTVEVQRRMNGID